MAENQAQSAINPQALEKILGISEHAFVVEMIDIFLADGQSLVAKLEIAVAEQDWLKISQAAHGFKSISGAMGANGLSKICSELETMAKTRTGCLSDVDLVQVRQEYELVRESLTFYRQVYGSLAKAQPPLEP